jgi:hypothetical protein
MGVANPTLYINVALRVTTDTLHSTTSTMRLLVSQGVNKEWISANILQTNSLLFFISNWPLCSFTADINPVLQS